jgi:serine/threonine-protein kinase RsbW
MLLVALPFAFRFAAAKTQFPARKAAPFVIEQTTRLVLPSHIVGVSDAAAAVADFVKDCGLDENTSFGVDMAVREAITNAVVHGNHEDDAKSVEVVFSCAENHLEIEVSDQGAGFDPASVPDPTDPANLLKTSGRGIFLMRSFMDQVEWRSRPAGGTTVRMVKRF